MEQKTVDIEDLIALVSRRKEPGAAQYWCVSKDVFEIVRKLSDDAGTLLFRPSAVGHPYALLGYPVEISQDPSWCGVDLLTYSQSDLCAPVADPVEHPTHYTSHPSGIECIQITEHMGFNLGNAVKYIWRADLKHDAVEDLRKAKWYIERELSKRGVK